LGKKRLAILLSTIICISTLTLLYSSCGEDDPASSNTGKVLVAQVSGDSVGTAFGVATKSQSVNSAQLDFTDRDSAEITFFYTGNSNNSSVPMTISFNTDSTVANLYSSSGLLLNSTEQSLTVTVPSPKVREFFFYTIKVSATGGFGYFKFRDLQIFKK